MEGPSVVVENGSEDDHNSIMDLPPGFRFHPTDEEIISHYLTPKVMNSCFSAVAVGEVDLNKCEPWDLPGKAKMGEKEWYFYCNRDRKYPTGMRTNRATEAGYWKATGKDKEIYKIGKSGCLIGMKKTLVFYKGRAPKGEKTNWVMHEYRLEGEFSYYKFHNKDEWVVSRIFHKSTAIRRNPFIYPTSINPYENDPHILEYCSNVSPLPSLVENPSHSSLIEEDEIIEGPTKLSSPLSIDREDDHYLSYLSTNMEDNQLQNYNTNHFTPQNYNNGQYNSIHPNYSFNFHPQNQAQNPIRTFANQAILRGMKEGETSSDADKQCKMEQLSSNHSIVSVSHDTTLSTDVTAETSSRPSDRIYELLDIDDPNLNVPNNVSDGFGYLWDY